MLYMSNKAKYENFLFTKQPTSQPYLPLTKLKQEHVEPF